MPKILIVMAAIGLALHGLIHVTGTAAYLRLADIAGLPYKTTVLGGRIDMGPGGIAMFGVLWLLPAFGFTAVALGVLVGWDWWQPLLVATTLFSLALISLDWPVAFVGGIVDLAILALLLLEPMVRRAVS